jgi:hypothetical protein
MARVGDSGKQSIDPGLGKWRGSEKSWHPEGQPVAIQIPVFALSEIRRLDELEA